jgi:predicted DNA-binding transcriptional regulator AlpA
MASESEPEPIPAAVWRLKDLATYFGVSRPTIDRWRDTGDLESVTHVDPGGRPFFYPDEVDAWARSRSSSDDVEAIA